MGEHLPCKQGVKSSNLSVSTFILITTKELLVWLRGQAVKTSPFHGGNTGSIPVGVICLKAIILIPPTSQLLYQLS